MMVIDLPARNSTVYIEDTVKLNGKPKQNELEQFTGTGETATQRGQQVEAGSVREEEPPTARLT